MGLPEFRGQKWLEYGAHRVCVTAQRTDVAKMSCSRITRRVFLFDVAASLAGYLPTF